MPPLSLWGAYRLRLKRKRLLWRSFRSRHHLTTVADRTSLIRPEDILVVMVQRNESSRLPYFMQFYRSLGVGHFLVIDNGSDDGSDQYLAEQQDVSLWQTQDSYHASRFGLDWMTWLQIRYAHGHWCLMVDVDELLVYDGQRQYDLRDLTAWLDRNQKRGFGTLMLDLYPKGPLNHHRYEPGQDPRTVISWFDPEPYRASRQAPLGNLWVQGGARERMFFADAPRRSPTLNKIPLIRWDRKYCYVNSSHSALPRTLNQIYDGPGRGAPSGVLLHTKFLPEIVSRSAIEKQRGQHFHTPADFDHYYDHITQAPDLWHPGSVHLDHLDTLVQHGLMSRIPWDLTDKD